MTTRQVELRRLKPRKSLEPYLKDEVSFYDHQIDGVRQMIRMRNFLLADDMGLGKSLQALTVAVADIKRSWAEKIIIVAPVTLKGNWADELEKFTRIPYVVFGQVTDPKNPERFKNLSPKKREEQLQEFSLMSGPRALICNYEQINKHLHDINRLGFDITIFDEAHYLKNPKALRTKACHKIQSRRYFMLTGTPMLNQVNELWGLLHLIDRVGYPKYYSFVNRYCVFGGYKDKQIIGVKNEKELTQRLNTVMIRRLKQDVLDLPEVQKIIRKLDLSVAQQKLYDRVEKELELPVVGQADPSEIENALTKLLRLKQICGTTLPFTGEDDSAKLDQAVEDAMEILKSGHKIVVFTQFRDVQAAFLSRLEKEIDAYRKQLGQQFDPFDLWELNGDIPQHDRTPLVKEWAADPKPGVMVCMLQVAGIGLNMTAARHLQFLDKLWVPGLNQQAIDRAHRIGADETQPVQVLEYHMKGTVETRVEYILNTKSKLFGTVINDFDFKKKLIEQLQAKQAA